MRIVTIMRYINTVPPHRASTEFFMGMEMGREEFLPLKTSNRDLGGETIPVPQFP